MALFFTEPEILVDQLQRTIAKLATARTRLRKAEFALAKAAVVLLRVGNSHPHADFESTSQNSEDPNDLRQTAVKAKESSWQKAQKTFVFLLECRKIFKSDIPMLQEYARTTRRGIKDGEKEKEYKRAFVAGPWC